LLVSALRVALVALSAAVLTAACAAGQQAQTANEKPSIDGTQGSVGSIQLDNVALHTPPSNSYAAGDSVPMSVYIANNGTTADTLTGVTSTAFTGWSVVATSSVPTGSASASASPSGLGAPPASTSASAPASGPAQQVGAGLAVGLGQTNLDGDGKGSDETLLLTGLADKSSPLYPGMTVKVTFTFAKAGQTTLTVPVRIGSTPNTQTLRPSYSPPSA
jgi:hypothetical protein